MEEKDVQPTERNAALSIEYCQAIQDKETIDNEYCQAIQDIG